MSNGRINLEDTWALSAFEKSCSEYKPILDNYTDDFIRRLVDLGFQKLREIAEARGASRDSGNRQPVVEIVHKGPAPFSRSDHRDAEVLINGCSVGHLGDDGPRLTYNDAHMTSVTLTLYPRTVIIRTEETSA